jgi:general secretion pathway protein G
MMDRIKWLLARRKGAPARRNRRAMSLVEVMVVIAIILTLMSIIAIGVWGIFSDSQVDTTRLTMTRVNERLEIYILRKKKAPSGADGLAQVFGNEPVPKDSWNNDFVFISPGPDGQPYDLISLGSDGQEGGTGNAEDIKWSEIRNQ